jgi:hypothetical protein
LARAPCLRGRHIDAADAGARVGRTSYFAGSHGGTYRDETSRGFLIELAERGRICDSDADFLQLSDYLVVDFDLLRFPIPLAVVVEEGNAAS